MTNSKYDYRQADSVTQHLGGVPKNYQAGGEQVAPRPNSTISELDGAVTKVSFSPLYSVPPKFKPQRWTAHALLCLRMDSVVSDSIAYDLVPLSVPNLAPSLGGL